MRAILILAAAAIATSCAKAPESISASYVSEIGYQSWTCEQLSGETLRLSEALSTASTQQNRARTNDTVGVIFIGLPVSSLSGDNIAPEIGRLKGEQEAVRRASITKRCTVAPAASAVSTAVAKP